MINKRRHISGAAATSDASGIVLWTGDSVEGEVESHAALID